MSVTFLAPVGALPETLRASLARISDSRFEIIPSGEADAVLAYVSLLAGAPEGPVVLFAPRNVDGPPDVDVVDIIVWPIPDDELHGMLVAAARRIVRERQRHQDYEQQRRIDHARVRIASANLELDPLMALVCEELLPLTNAEGTVVEMVDGGDVVYRAAAGSLRASVGFRMPLVGSLTGQVIQSGSILVSDDTDDDPRVNREATRALSIRSMVIAPLQAGDEVVGVLKMAASCPMAFRAHDLSAVETMTGLIGAALKREISRAQLEDLAYHDPLTGLANRRAFQERAERAVARACREGAATAILMIDVDHFKRVNDEFGHAAGDEVLRSLARHIRNTLRPSDISGRLGGEEFAVVLPEVDERLARQVAERIRLSVSETAIPFADHWIRVTVSIGIALTDARTDYCPALQLADEALYRAKAAGRNQVALARATRLRAAG